MAGERSYFSKESVNCVVRGHHVYKHIWTPGIGEELSVEKEPGNLHDSFAVSAWINIEFASSCFLGLSAAHLTAFNLKVKSYDAFLFDITNTRTHSHVIHASVQAGFMPAPAHATRPRRLFENRRLLLYRTCDPRR